MSNLHKKYLSLKIENSDCFYLFESGIFYLFIDADAMFMSNALNLKLTNLSPHVVKCGFPITHLDKYMNILRSKNINNVKFVSPSSFLAYSQKDYFTNNKAKDLIKKISTISTDDLSVSQTYELLNELIIEAKDVVRQIDEV